MNTPIKVLLAVFALSMIEMEISVAGNFTWTGSSSTDWNTSGNWSPSGVPGSGDTVTIVTGSNNVYLAGNTPVTKFTMTSGTVDLQTYTLTISSASTFTSGQVNNGNLVMYGTSTLIFSGTRFGASVYATGNSVLLNGSTFNDTLSVVKKGASADNSKGGNTFNGAVSIIDSANANLILSDSFPDVFNSRLWLANQGTAKVYVAHRGTGNEFNDDVTFIGKNIWSNYYGTATYDGDITFDTPDGEVYFGYSTGSCSLGDGKNLYVGGSGFSAGYLYFRNFTQSDSTVSISLTLTGSARMWFESGSSFKAEINASAPFLYLDGTRFLGEAHITTTGTSSSTSVGGSYFAKATTIYHNPAGACTFTSGNTYVDTFAAPVLLKNGIGTMSINKSLFQDSVTFQNLNTVTGSDRFYISNSGNATMEGVVTLSNALAGMNFGNAGGTTTLDSSARLNVEGSYTGNLTLKNFVQLGANPVSITLNNTSTKLIVNSGTSFEGNFTYFGRNIQLNEATFNDTTTITRYGTGGDNCTGGNTFNGPATIMDSSGTGHSFIMAGTRGDDFNNTVTFIQKGTGVNLYPAYTGTSTFAAGVIFDGTSAIQVGYGGGKAKFDGIGTQSISRIGTNTPVFKKIELSKSSGSLELESPVTLTDSLILSRGILRSDSINLLCLNDNCIATAGSDSGYVEGFMKKTGNDAFTFPLGAEELAHPYHPMRISSPASSADAFLAAYLAEQQPLGDDMDSAIENVNACQYWKLYRTAGTSNIVLNLSWNHDSCITVDPDSMRITGWSGGKWQNLGNGGSTGDSLVGTVYSGSSITNYGYFTLANKLCASLQVNPLVTDVSCKGRADGFVDANVSYGTKPYTYTWSNGNGSQDVLYDLSADTFAVEVTDYRGCLLRDTVMIREPDSMEIDVTTTPSYCIDTSGSAMVEVKSGGTGPFRYYWISTGDTTDSIVYIPKGIYPVSVTDSKGCIAVKNALVASTTGPVFTFDHQRGISCHGGNDGRVEIGISSGTAPFQYLWVDEGDTTSTKSNFSSGTYTVQVSDSNGCISFDEITFSDPDPMVVTPSITSSGCNDSTGRVSLNITGGNSPFTYYWFVNGDTTNTKYNAPAGRDTVRVTDSTGCVVDVAVLVEDSGSIRASASVLKNVLCYLDSTGIAWVLASGGTEPYTYSWEPYGGVNDTAVDLAAGPYQVTVMDSNGCHKTTPVFIADQPPLHVNIYSTDATNDTLTDGVMGAVAQGGVPPYSFLWSTSDTTDVIENLGIGDYSITVTDAYGCTTSAGKTIKVRLQSHCFSCNTDAGYTPCTYTTITHSCWQDKDLVTDFGAVPDDPVSDQCAIETAIDFFRHNLCNIAPPGFGSPIYVPGNGKLTIPEGLFIVGKEVHVTNPSDVYLKGQPIICLDGFYNFTIEGVKDLQGNPLSTLYYEDCMSYGLFDPATGDRYLAPPDCNGLVDSCRPMAQPGLFQHVAFPGNCINIYNSDQVSIKNLELDGNTDNSKIGGRYYDGIQLPYDGIFVDHSTNVEIRNMNVHHFGRDGIQIGYRLCHLPPRTKPGHGPPMNMIIVGCRFEWNGRSGCSWTNGNGVAVYSSSFNYSGQARFASATGNGLDIEFEGSTILENGFFAHCDFIHNISKQIQSDAGNGYSDFWTNHFEFQSPYIVASEYDYALWPNARDFSFYGANSKVCGDLVWAYNAPICASCPINSFNTKFENIIFEDKYHEIIPGTGSAWYYMLRNPHPCGTAHSGSHQKMINLTNGITGPSRVSFVNCTFNTHDAKKLGDFYGGIGSWNAMNIQNCTFRNYQMCQNSGCDSYIAVFRNIYNAATNEVHFGATYPTTYCTVLHQNYFYDPWNGGPVLIPNTYWDLAPDSCSNYPRYTNPFYSHRVDLYAPACSPCSSACCGFVTETTPTCPSIPDSKMRNLDFPSVQGDTYRIYPNPSFQLLNMEGVKAGDVVEIFNGTGSLLLKIKAESTTLQIHIEKFKPGMYFIQTSNQNSVKFIKSEP